MLMGCAGARHLRHAEARGRPTRVRHGRGRGRGGIARVRRRPGRAHADRLSAPRHPGRRPSARKGAAACRDAMKYLETVPRTTPLAFAGAGLRFACEDHALDAGGRVMPRRALCAAATEGQDYTHNIFRSAPRAWPRTAAPTTRGRRSARTATGSGRAPAASVYGTGASRTRSRAPAIMMECTTCSTPRRRSISSSAGTSGCESGTVPMALFAQHRGAGRGVAEVPVAARIGRATSFGVALVVACRHHRACGRTVGVAA